MLIVIVIVIVIVTSAHITHNSEGNRLTVSRKQTPERTPFFAKLKMKLNSDRELPERYGMTPYR